MNITDLLGGLMQAGMAPSTNRRLQNAMGGQDGGLLESLGGMLGGQSGGSGAGGLGDLLSGALGGKGGGGLGGMLGDVLGQAGRMTGGNRNLALGGLGALAGAVLGGGGRSMRSALGGGVMALLGAMAFKALQGSGQESGKVPLGLTEPQTESDQRALEQQAELVLQAMINAAKSDGSIDREEIQRIVGKLQEMGADEEALNYVRAEMQAPMRTAHLIAAAGGQPEVAAEIYAASLMAIEVDTPAEKMYLNQLASGLRLDPQTTGRIEEMIGLQPT